MISGLANCEGNATLEGTAVAVDYPTCSAAAFKELHVGVR